MPSQVLVIDNDRQVRDLLVAALKADGHHAAGVRTYPEAIAHLHQGPVDLAITDGFTALGLAGVSTLRSLFPTLRLLVVSGSVSHSVGSPQVPRSLTLLPKPCRVATMLAVVRHTLHASSLEFVRAILERGRFDVLTTLALSPHAPASPAPSSEALLRGDAALLESVDQAVEYAPRRARH